MSNEQLASPGVAPETRPSLESQGRPPRVYGEPLLELPRDLYIPPDALQVFLDAFEGPLDLLLYLIRKQNLNVLDIPMALLTQQYLEYVEAIRGSQRFELASEYLLMAAMLIEIKSRMLLPRPASTDTPEADPRAELVRRLLEYEQFKLAAAELDRLPRAERDFAVLHVLFERQTRQRLPEVHPEDLRRAWLQLLSRARLNRTHLVSRETLSVRDRMSQLLRRLEPGKHVEFFELFDEAVSVPLVVVTFLAILELAREQIITVSQTELYRPIYVQRALDPPPRDDREDVEAAA
ncbi:MAG: segregation/condensation protein A [Casimicrobiaceae bacterium]|nr:segregation/condensation protein A [Casimicrobiaceae bacterium]MCX8098611.1 segregation/condensation protein A [Casimicrobiaceae bacterium]MDW8312028.1 ScpA family protein [Burkholderiales bacterium]